MPLQRENATPQYSDKGGCLPPALVGGWDFRFYLAHFQE
jgi:hypothetical protein